VIENVEYASGAVAVEVRESNATTNFARALPPQRTYYLRNQSMSEAIGGTADSTHVTWGFLPYSSGGGPGLGFTATRLFVEFPGRGVEAQPFTIDGRWLDRAELVIVQLRQAEAFERTLEIQDFPLGLEPPKPTAQENDGGAQP
jgi:hypothetical protein